MDSGEIPGNGSNPKRQRRVYPFSIVAGGVHGREELAVAMSRDSLVERHYSDFDVSKTRVAKLAAPKTGFVSYRLNNKVYWTKNKITLPRGEEVLTDGVNYARTRCGNRISENEPGETSALEPPPEALDTPTEDLIATQLPDDSPQYSGPDSSVPIFQVWTIRVRPSSFLNSRTARSDSQGVIPRRFRMAMIAVSP
jgi:hypothetical protein